MSSNKLVYILITISCASIILYYTTLQQNQALSVQYDTLRQKYGALSCKCNGIGPTGGFCLQKGNFRVGGNQLWCKKLAKELRRLLMVIPSMILVLGWDGTEKHYWPKITMAIE